MTAIIDLARRTYPVTMRQYGTTFIDVNQSKREAFIRNARIVRKQDAEDFIKWIRTHIRAYYIGEERLIDAVSKAIVEDFTKEMAKDEK